MGLSQLRYTCREYARARVHAGRKTEISCPQYRCSLDLARKAVYIGGKKLFIYLFFSIFLTLHNTEYNVYNQVNITYTTYDNYNIYNTYNAKNTFFLDTNFIDNE